MPTILKINCKPIQGRQTFTQLRFVPEPDGGWVCVEQSEDFDEILADIGGELAYPLKNYPDENKVRELVLKLEPLFTVVSEGWDIELGRNGEIIGTLTDEAEAAWDKICAALDGLGDHYHLEV